MFPFVCSGFGGFGWVFSFRSNTTRTCVFTAPEPLSLLHRHCICCTGTASAAQALHLLHRHCICCTGAASAAQALYLLHRHCSCCTGTVSAAQALHLLHSNSRSRKLFKKAVLGDTSLCCTSLCSAMLRARVHTSIYIYIYIIYMHIYNIYIYI